MIFAVVNDSNGDCVDVTKVSHVITAQDGDKYGFATYVVMENGLYVGSHLTATELRSRMENKLGRSTN